MNSSPLVSILIPTHNRPDYFELALNSVLVQNYENIEIIVSDNSDDDLTYQRILPYLGKHQQINYSRVPGFTATENFRNCFELSKGEFVNYLMDDDLFQSEKISKMMVYMLAYPNVGLVTSFRQLIDGEGSYLDPIPGTAQLFGRETSVGGISLGDFILTNGRNVVGEPTTALFRRGDIEESFGRFQGKEYVVLSDVATWLSILSHRDCIYIPEALSFFRIHAGQDQKSGHAIRIKSNIEWLQLLCDAIQNGAFLFSGQDTRELLTSKLLTSIWFLSSVHEEIKAGAYEIDKIQALVWQATSLLLKK